MAEHTLYNNVWNLHKVAQLATGADQLLIGLHLVHEVTSPQAFAALKEQGKSIKFPNRTYATMDHIIPTDVIARPYQDPQAELMGATLEKNANEFGIQFFGRQSGKQGIVHVLGPELGLTQPGMTIACGDSHTSTHGAFGALAFGIGTTEVHHVMQTQTLSLIPLKVRRVEVNGSLETGVYAKDVILKIIEKLGVKGGIGFVYEYAGSVFESMSMEERMTVCNMSIEGGARIGYINPDDTTFEYVSGREFAPKGQAFDKALSYWKSIQSRPDAEYDDIVTFDASDIEPMVTWGINPGQGVGISEQLPDPAQFSGADRRTLEEAFDYMSLQPGQSMAGVPIDVAFIGSCTNSRISDLREVAHVLDGRRVSESVKTLVVPGSQQVKSQAEAEGLDKIFTAAGAEWREPGCSMCLAMNPDKLIGNQVCASSSNRNFMGRQGSATGRTLLMSPAMVAAAAVKGHVTDVRQLLEGY